MALRLNGNFACLKGNANVIGLGCRFLLAKKGAVVFRTLRLLVLLAVSVVGLVESVLLSSFGFGGLMLQRLRSAYVKGPSTARIIEAQQALKDDGIYSGSVDGEMNPKDAGSYTRVSTIEPT
jgi:hypothetical protein